MESLSHKDHSLYLSEYSLSYDQLHGLLTNIERWKLEAICMCHCARFSTHLGTIVSQRDKIPDLQYRPQLITLLCQSLAVGRVLDPQKLKPQHNFSYIDQINYFIAVTLS